MLLQEVGLKTVYKSSLGLSVFDLGPMYATDVRQHHQLMLPPIRGVGITNQSGQRGPQSQYTLGGRCNRLGWAELIAELICDAVLMI